MLKAKMLENKEARVGTRASLFKILVEESSGACPRSVASTIA
ncbi:MAG: hypothetical protein ACK4GN_02455 [Runella sp.]